MGYSRAGFEVVGVDNRTQPRYPFEFHQGDALEFLRLHGHEFDAIHASPPCQRFSTASRQGRTRPNHPDLIEPTRRLLIASGRPWVMENVPGAPLIDPFRLCGTMFGLRTPCGAELWRHRHFETNWWIGLLPQCDHRSERVITVTGATAQRNIGRNKAFETFPVTSARIAMGMDWVGMKDLSQAIPPAYTRFIGERLLETIRAETGKVKTNGE